MAAVLDTLSVQVVFERGELLIYYPKAGEFVGIAALLRSGLLEEADAAFHENDRHRFIDAVDRLDGVFDDEYEAD